MSVFNSTVPCPANKPEKPARKCPDDIYHALDAEVSKKCKGNGEKRTCKNIRDCTILLQNIVKNEECLIARQNLSNTCFQDNIDSGHVNEIENSIKAVATCKAQIEAYCKQEPEPEPQPQAEVVPQPIPQTTPQEIPQAVPVDDNDFMKKMAKLTGLTGTALIIYLIISEGSRLFIPRNAIPIP